jgi:hypothetical protein
MLVELTLVPALAVIVIWMARLINHDGTWEADIRLESDYAALRIKRSCGPTAMIAASPEVGGEISANHQAAVDPPGDEPGRGPEVTDQAGGKPAIRITRPAPLGGGGPDEMGSIAGTASEPGLTDCKVVLYAQTNKWYVQPFVDRPYTDIGDDGTWEAEIHLGRRYAALLVRSSYRPATTLAALPRVGGDILAIHQVSSEPEGTRKGESRRLRFSGYEWRVKSSDGRVGPGPNYFSDGEDSAFVDDRGRLHLRIAHRDGRWWCSEVISERSFGYGTYRFYLDSNVDDLDPNIVLGLFTWNDAPAYHHREIDVEISRWGDPNNRNAQFVVQPYTRPRNIARFQVPPGLAASTHVFTWEPERISCRSLAGLGADPAETKGVIQQHTFTQDIPRAGGENARINLWLLAGKRPVGARSAELVISKFEFVP